MQRSDKNSTTSIYQSIGAGIRNNRDVISTLLFFVTMAALLERAFGYIYVPPPTDYYPYFNVSAPTTSVYLTGNGTDYRLDLYGPYTTFTDQFNNLANLFDNGTCGVNGNVSRATANMTMTLIKQWGGDWIEFWRGLDQETQNATEQCIMTMVQNTYDSWNKQMDIALIIILSTIFGVPGATAAILCAICCCPGIFRCIRDAIQNRMARVNQPAEAAAQVEAGNAQPMEVIQPQQPKQSADEEPDADIRPPAPR